MITMREESKGNYKGFFNFYLEDGTKIPKGFTPETGREASERYCKLLNEHKHVVAPLVKQYIECIEWNHAHRGQGKNWPVFNKLERLLDNLQKMAGIVNT